MNDLLVSRAADRKRMVAAIQSVCNQWGATCNVETRSYAPRAFRFALTMGEATLYFDIDGDSRQHREGVFVATWNISGEAIRQGYQFRYRGHHKLTRVYQGFADLLISLADDFQAFADGLMIARYRWTVYNRTTLTDPFVQTFATEYAAQWCAREWREAWPTNRYVVEREAA